MKIETKFNIGDNIWFMSANKPASHKIAYIRINVDRENVVEIGYTPDGLVLKLIEKDVFSTKEELIASL